MRTRSKVANLESETNYTFTLRAFGDALVSVATRTGDQFSVATLYTFDGTRKATLAGGSRYLDADQMFELAPGVLAVFDQGAPSHPYNVYVHNLASGGTVAKFVVQMDDDNDEMKLATTAKSTVTLAKDIVSEQGNAKHTVSSSSVTSELAAGKVEVTSATVKVNGGAWEVT